MKIITISNAAILSVSDVGEWSEPGGDPLAGFSAPGGVVGATSPPRRPVVALLPTSAASWRGVLAKTSKKH